MDFLFKLQPCQVVIQLLHHPQQRIFVGIVSSVVGMVTLVSLINSSDHQIHVTRLNRKLSRHGSKYLDPNKTIPVLVLKSVLYDVFYNLDKTLSLLAHRVFKQIDFFDFVFHFSFKLVKE